MKILFDILHPAHVHFFRNAILLLKSQGDNIVITARSKDVCLPLLKEYGLDYICLSEKRSGFFGSLWEFWLRFFRLFFIVKKFKPDIMVACTGVSVGPISFLTKIPNLQFYNTEKAGWQNFISFPFATKIFTPRAYQDNISAKQERYDGCHELAYLHPNYFIEDRGVLSKLGLKDNERYCVLRFVSFQAVHDRGVNGISLSNKKRAISEFSKHARVFISSEGKLPAEFKKYKLPTAAGDIHSVLAGASLLFGESATMASEASVLGVPAIFVYGYKLGYLEEQEKKYKTVYSFLSDKNSQERAVDLGVEILKNISVKKEWLQKRQILINDTVDVTDFIIRQIKKYA